MTLFSEMSAFYSSLLQELGERAEDKARLAIGSRTLRQALEHEQTGLTTAQIFVSHHWSVFYHDGRGTALPKGQFLVWFRNPRDDPRNIPGYPKTTSQIKKLTPAQWQRGLMLNTLHRANGGSYETQPMIIARRSSPTRGAEFFTTGMLGFKQIAAPIVRARFERFLDRVVEEDETKAAVINFG